MAITKETEIPKIEVVNSWNIQVATDTVIKEDGTEISRSRHRLYLLHHRMINLVKNGHILQRILVKLLMSGDSKHDVDRYSQGNYKTFTESQEV